MEREIAKLVEQRVIFKHLIQRKSKMLMNYFETVKEPKFALQVSCKEKRVINSTTRLYKNDKIIPQEVISEDIISFYKIGDKLITDLECYTAYLKIVKI